MEEHLVFVQSNNPAGNQILVYDQAEEGTLTLTETVDTGGNGGRNEGAGSEPLSSQGSLSYHTHHRMLIAVNAGSNTLSVLGLEDDHLRLRQVLASGGTFPVSVTTHGDLVYVLNAHKAGAVTGYRITDGHLHPIDDSTRSWQLKPVTGPTQFLNTPGQISFTPDGQHLVITTKANGSQIDVFTVGHYGQPSATFTANPAGTPIPFGFTFANHGHLVVTDAAINTLTTYTVHPDGTVTRLASHPNGQQAMCWIAHTAGNFYVANTGSNTVTGYHIDAQGTPTVFTQTATRAGTVDLVGTRDGQFLYVQVGTAGGVDGFPHQARWHARPGRHAHRSDQRGRHRRQLSRTCRAPERRQPPAPSPTRIRAWGGGCRLPP
jgi:6-phosphogluconolactonase (cycloisomerase 2 family)